MSGPTLLPQPKPMALALPNDNPPWCRPRRGWAFDSHVGIVISVDRKINGRAALETAMLIGPQENSVTLLTDPLRSQKKTHYIVLDGLRGVAAISVFAFHGRWWLPQIITFQHGYLAVDFFFMLSGFVIGYAYERKLASRSMPFVRFVRLRAIRLYPLIMLGSVIGLTPLLWNALHNRDYSLLQVLSFLPFAALAVPCWMSIAAVPYPLNGPTWSLSCEIAANFAYAALVRRLSNRVLTVIALASFGVETWCSFDVGTIGKAGAVSGPMMAIIARTIFPFSIGLLIYRLHIASRLPRLSLGQGALAIILIATFLPPEIPLNALYEMVCIGVVYPLIIVAGCQHIPSGAMAKLAKVSADLSFPLYALHYPFVKWFGIAVNHFHLSHRAAGACYLVFMTFIVIGAWRVFAIDSVVRKKIADIAARPDPPSETIFVQMSSDPHQRDQR
jgi:peptidoglycan/LPS O-acetylase OafA/YrhL